MPSDAPMIALALLAGGLLLGALFLWLLRRQDHKTWVLARAPELPIRVLADGDDAWLRGSVHCSSPLQCPWFGNPCVAFSYKREREHTWTTTDKDGNTQTHTEWRTEVADRQACDFDLDDGARIRVRTAKAELEALSSIGTDYETGTLRHSASILELGAVVSVLGVKQDDGSFAAQAEVPCLVTRKAAQKRVAGSAGAETALFFFACLLPFVGGALAVWQLRGPDSFRSFGDWLWLLPGGLLAMLPIWWVGVFNRLVRLRQQVLTAFHQVDVDLAVRAGLVPNLVSVVKATAAHESGLLAALAAIRSGLDPHAAASAEGAALATTRAVLALHERYPELRANALYLDLHDRLWAVEEKLAHTRSLYNGIVKEWNDRTATFPSLLVARCCGYRQAPQFSGDDAPLPPRLRNRDAVAK